MADYSFEDLVSLFLADERHSREWRKNAYESFEFVAGRQWSAEDEAKLRAENKVPVTFNRVNPVLHAVAGSEIKNREEVRFFPVEEGDIEGADLMTQAAQWFRNKAEADTEESEAFYDTLVCGMGWTRTYVDYDADPDGEPAAQHIDPLEMVWDCGARKRGLKDARRFWHVRTIPLSEAKEMFADKFKADSELNASWARLDTLKNTSIDPKRPEYQEMGVKSGDEDIDEVTIVHLEIKCHEKAWRVFDVEQNAIVWMNDEEYETYQERINILAEQAGLPAPEIKAVRQTRTYWRKYFIGGKILETIDLDTTEPSFHCITGYKDHNSGTWFGLLEMMKDPQRWANKWLSQILFMLGVLAKGGVMVRKDAVEDTNDFRRSWARADEVTVVDDLEGIAPKPQQSVPSQMFTMVQHAIQSITEVSGVNPEILGQRAAIQPIGLEQERKETALTILANLFDSLRVYRRRQGKLIYELLKNYLNDGRLIRIVGEGQARYVPLAVRQDVKYDVFVDEAPQSQYVKQQVWQFVAPMLPQIPPQITAELLKFAPIPASIAEEVSKKLAQMAQDPAAQMQKQLDIAKQQADIQMTQSAAMSKQAEAEQRQAEAQSKKAKINLDVAKTAADFVSNF